MFLSSKKENLSPLEMKTKSRERKPYSELTAARELMRTSNATGSAVPKSALSRKQNEMKNI